MSEVTFFVLIFAAVTVIGGWWLLRSILRPSTDPSDPDEPVVIANAGTEANAELLRAKLDAFGIRAFTRNRLGRIFWGNYGPATTWDILVRGDDVEEAERIIGK